MSTAVKEAAGVEVVYATVDIGDVKSAFENYYEQEITDEKAAEWLADHAADLKESMRNGALDWISDEVSESGRDYIDDDDEPCSCPQCR